MTCTYVERGGYGGRCRAVVGLGDVQSRSILLKPSREDLRFEGVTIPYFAYGGVVHLASRSYTRKIPFKEEESKVFKTAEDEYGMRASAESVRRGRE